LPENLGGTFFDSHCSLIGDIIIGGNDANGCALAEVLKLLAGVLFPVLLSTLQIHQLHSPSALVYVYIKLCYLPPDRGDIPASTPAEAKENKQELKFSIIRPTAGTANRDMA